MKEKAISDCSNSEMQSYQPSSPSIESTMNEEYSNLSFEGYSNESMNFFPQVQFNHSWNMEQGVCGALQHSSAVSTICSLNSSVFSLMFSLIHIA